MGNIHSRRARRGFVGAVAALSVVAGAAVVVQNSTPASATLTPRIAAAGSDTTEDLMTELLVNQYGEFNVPTKPGSTPGYPVAADDDCGDLNYLTAGDPAIGTADYVAAPNGSGAGKAALIASVNNSDGCIDIARSSSGPSGSDPVGLEYYAYAIDAVGWSSASTSAPAELTLTELQDIYKCKTTADDWSEVGGSAGSIVRYWPQIESGTRSFAESAKFLGFNPTILAGQPGAAAGMACTTQPILTQENTGEEIFNNGHANSDGNVIPGPGGAIFVYSGAEYNAQRNGTSTDVTFGQTIRQLNGLDIVRFVTGTWVLNTPTVSPAIPGPEGPVSAANAAPTGWSYPGIRFVYNILYNGSASYTQAEALVGSSSPLCNGGHATEIEAYGFAQAPPC